MPSLTTSWPAMAVMSLPFRVTLPCRARWMPLMVRRVVDLPAPLEPIRVTISPLPTSMVTPLRAWMLP